MNKKTWIYLILDILIFFASCDIQIELQKTHATLQTNKKISLKFKVKGIKMPYSIKFIGIPNTWETSGNDLVISNFNQQSIEEWTFDINVSDAQKKNFYQTVKLVINEFQIMIYSMTIAQTHNPFSSKESVKFKSQSNQYNLADLINRFPGINKDNNFRINTNYVASSIITPQIIATSQATWQPQRDSKPISMTQIKKNAAILRQNNADKAIANLVFIIQGLNKKINNLQNNLDNETNILQNLKDTAFNCSEVLFNVQNNQAKINNAIADRIMKKKQNNEQIQSINKILQNLQVNLTILNNQKLQIEKNVTPEGLSFVETQKKIIDCQKNIKNTNAQIDNITGKIKSNNLQINLVFNNVDDANLRLVTINQSLGIVQQKIDDLNKQLKEAQEQQLSLLKDQAMFLVVPIQSKIKIDNLDTKNQDLKQLLKNLTVKNNQQIKLCQKSSTNIYKIKHTISQRQQNYSLLLFKIQNIKNKTASSQKSIKDYNSNIDSLSLEIGALNKQLDKANLFELQQRYVCAVSQEKRNRQQSNINDLNAKIIQNNQALAQTNKNLQAARAEKQLADLAVQQIIAQTADVTLFSIVPNGGSTVLGGNPLGNNPSGSALGPAFRVDTIEKGSLHVNNISSYLSKIYNMNIDPTQLLANIKPQPQSPVKTIVMAQSSLNMTDLSSFLYPLDPQSRNQIINPQKVSTGQTYSNCLSTAQLQTRSGIIQSASIGSIIVRDKLNQKFTLKISPCTKIASTKSSNFFAPGNKVYFTGVQLFNILTNTLFDAYSVFIVPF